MNRPPFANGEFYHVYNRGVDKREIFTDNFDSIRFLQSMIIFNDQNPIGSIYEQNFDTYALKKSGKKLVEIICYCLNPNHFHFLLEQKTNGGISEFMKRLSGGYTWSFNNKYKRGGALFQGRFKSNHVDSSDYLLHLSAYVNLNDQVHQLGGSTAKLVRSSWDEYLNKGKDAICKKKIIMDQFDSVKDYEKFALDSLLDMNETKREAKELKKLFHE
ncbi:MAG TPA: transposase [Candidatus Paceibacterota bacterium]